MTATHKPKIVHGSALSTTARSVARLYPQGVSLVTSGRNGLSSVSIQNLESSNTVRFWHGLIPEDAFDLPNTNYLPEDPADWSAPQVSHAVGLLSTYGEKVEAGQYLEPFLTPTQQIYSYVALGTVAAHVKEG